MPGPLEGVRVVEVAGIGPVPYAGLLLAELGADVVRVDRSDQVGVPEGGVAPMASLHRSRPSLAVDLKSEAGRSTVLRLVEQADVLLEGMRPGVMERLGLGPDVCLARSPGLVYGRMTGWGQDGPLASAAGHDITYAALSGALHVTGPPEKPYPAANLVADFGGGTLFLVVGVLAALQSRHRTGVGQVVDAAMVDGAASLLTLVYGLLGSGWADERGSNLLDGGCPFYDSYRCSDGRFVAIGPLEPPFYAALLAGLGVTFVTAQYDRSGWPEQRRVLTEVFATRTRDEWVEHFAGTDACVAPVLALGEAPDHPHLAARDTFVEVDGHRVPRVAPRFSATPGLDPTPARPAGADTRAVLAQWGFGDDEVEDLIVFGAVAQAAGDDALGSRP